MVMSRLSRLVLVGLVTAASAHAQSAPADGAAAAAQDLYQRISARDASVLRYVPAEGFSEITNGSALHQLDAAAFKALFASTMQIDLHAEGVRAAALGDAVLVTGTRVGAVTPPGQAPTPSRQAFSMVWTQAAGQWQLRHVHLSTASAEAAKP